MARHGENIHKRKDGRWEGRYIKGRSETGKAIWGYVYAYSYVDAKTALIRKKVKTADYTVPLGAQELTFSVLSELWLSTLNDLEESSIAHYRYSIEHYILPVIGDLRISQLSGAKLELCVLQIISPVGGEHKPFGASLSRECISLVRRLCKYAYKLHLMPMIELSIKPVKETNEFPEALSLEEQAAVNRFVFKNPTPRKAGILFMLQLGLRISEVCGLQWGDIDLVHKEVRIRRGVRRIAIGTGKTSVVVQAPKTESSKRVLPIPPRLSVLLQMLYQKNTFGSDVWFLSCSSKPVEPRCYRKSIHGYLAKAGAHDVNPHMLRHTFATTCLQAGCDIKTLSELMGHSNPNITLQRYVHTNMERKSNPDVSKVYTYQIDIFKYATVSGSETALTGATFQLKTSKETTEPAIELVKETNNVYHVKGADETKTDDSVTTDATGKITIKGLKAGTYYLHETAAPTGYNKLTTPVTIVITPDTDDLSKFTYTVNGVENKKNDSTVKVENLKGTMLPETGSFGTIGLTILGVAVVLLGVFAPKKKKENR